MKKKIVTTIVSAMVCASMLGTTCFAATATPGELGNDEVLTDTDVSGENVVEATIFKLTIPTKLTFAVDAFEQKGKSQIASADFTVTNKSNIPVIVNVSFKAEKGTDPAANTPVFVDAPDKVTDDDKFTAYMEASVAKTVTESKTTAAAFTTPGALKKGTVASVADTVYLATLESGLGNPGGAAVETFSDVESTTVTYPDTTLSTPEKENLYPVTKAEGNKITFALAGASYIHYVATADASNKPATWGDAYETTAADSKGSAAYKIQGKVNPNVKWKAKDIKVTATYNFNGLSQAQYTAYTTDNAVDGAQGLISMDEAPVFTASTTEKGVFTYTEGKGKEAIASIKSVMMINPAGDPYDGFNAFQSYWADATVVGGKVTLDPKFINFFEANTEAVITYTTTGGEDKTATITIKCV